MNILSLPIEILDKVAIQASSFEAAHVMGCTQHALKKIKMARKIKKFDKIHDEFRIKSETVFHLGEGITYFYHNPTNSRRWTLTLRGENKRLYSYCEDRIIYRNSELSKIVEQSYMLHLFGLTQLEKFFHKRHLHPKRNSRSGSAGLRDLQI